MPLSSCSSPVRRWARMNLFLLFYLLFAFCRPLPQILLVSFMHPALKNAVFYDRDFEGGGRRENGFGGLRRKRIGRGGKGTESYGTRRGLGRSRRCHRTIIVRRVLTQLDVLGNSSSLTAYAEMPSAAFSFFLLFFIFGHTIVCFIYCLIKSLTMPCHHIASHRTARDSSVCFSVFPVSTSSIRAW